jgi:hypothetical protein
MKSVKTLLKNLFAIIITLPCLNYNAFAQGGSKYPNLSGVALFEVRADRINSSNTKKLEPVSGFVNIDTNFSLNLQKNWSIITNWHVRQVNNISKNSAENPERYRSILFNRGINLNDEGLVVEQLKAHFQNDDAKLFFGKFNPSFGSAFREEKRIGIFTTDFTKDYELREKLGAGFSALLENSEIEFSLFSNDRTALNEAMLNKRDINNIDNIAGDKSSYSISMKGKDLFGVRDLVYNIGYRNLAVKNIDGKNDEIGVVGGLEYKLPIDSKFLFIPFIEVASIDNLGGKKNRDALYTTIAFVTKYKNWTASISSIKRDIKHRNEYDDTKDSQMQYSIGYEISNNIIVDITKAKVRESGYSADLIGINASYIHRF